MLSSLSKLFARVISVDNLRTYAWASLVSQILIVVTGGLVRLTGSGLGCPTWPKCTADSLTTVPEQGYHGLIEFGNRLLTFALLVVAVLTILAVFNRAVDRSLALRSPAVILLAGIPAQAILGGFTVLTKLNPWLVGAHFILSAVMIVTASVLVWRVYAPEPALVPARAYALAPSVSIFGAISVVIGVLVTGAGPHAGDAQSIRNGLDLETWFHYHSYPAYVLLALIVVEILYLIRANRNENAQLVLSVPTKIALGLLVGTVIQAVIGVLQARLGVPAGLVAVHMLGASCLVSLVTFNHLAVRAK